MANITTTNIDLSVVCLETPYTEDETFTAGGAGTTAAGTLLGRITASGKLIVCDDAAVDGSQVAVAVLQYDVVAAGAGDLTIRPVLKGRVRKDKIFYENADPIVPATLDQLRTMGIIAVDVDQLGKFNNS
jgi:hypothetical protein